LSIQISSSDSLLKILIITGLVAGVALLVHNWQPSSGPMGLILAVVVTALLFDPVRKWIQDRVDQFFYRTRYDYRRTLLEFGRELGSETNLDAMLFSLVIITRSPGRIPSARSAPVVLPTARSSSR